MKSSLVILYHREPHDEVVKDGKIHYVPKKSPNGIVPTLKSFFADVNQGTWIAWKQLNKKQQASFCFPMYQKAPEKFLSKRLPALRKGKPWLPNNLMLGDPKIKFQNTKKLQ